MVLEQINAGGDRNFGYWIFDESDAQAAIIDPSGNPQEFLKRVDRDGALVRWVIATHDHGDHTGGMRELATKTMATTTTTIKIIIDDEGVGLDILPKAKTVPPNEPM